MNHRICCACVFLNIVLYLLSIGLPFILEASGYWCSSYVTNCHIETESETESDSDSDSDSERESESEIASKAICDGNMVFIVGPPQIGKTRITTEVLENLISIGKLSVDNFMIITGVSSIDWKKQFVSRVPEWIMSKRKNKNNVCCHRPDLNNKKTIKYIKKAINNNEPYFIIIDEAHVASKKNQTIDSFLKRIYEVIIPDADTDSRSHDVSHMYRTLIEKNIHIMLISATMDAVKYCFQRSLKDKTTTVVIDSMNYPTYTGAKKLLESGILHMSRDISDTPEGRLMAKEIRDHHLSAMNPSICIIRNKNSTSAKIIREIYGDEDVEIIYYDSENTIPKSTNNKFRTFEEMLLCKPDKPIVLLIKDMLRLSQTFSLKYVNTLYDDVSKIPNNSVIIQSLFGRACGHNKDYSNVKIWTHIPSVENYRDLMEARFDHTEINSYKGYNMSCTASVTYVKQTYGGRSHTVKKKKTRSNPDLIDKLRCALLNKNNILRKILDLYTDNGTNFNVRNKHLYIDEIEKIHYPKRLQINNYTVWNDLHCKYMLLKQIEGSKMYSINDEILYIVQEIYTI